MKNLRNPPIVIDRRPRCGVRAIGIKDEYACDRERGHDGEHEAFYGWSGESVVWA